MSLRRISVRLPSLLRMPVGYLPWQISLSPVNLGFCLCLSLSLEGFFSKLFRNASVRSSPVWFAMQSNTHSTSAISSARSCRSPSLNDCSPYLRAIIRASSPTSSVSIAMLVSSLKYLTPYCLIHSSTRCCASCIVIISGLGGMLRLCPRASGP